MEKSRYVIVIEEDDDAREAISLFLDLWGHEVAVAASGEEGLELLDQCQPDLMLVDVGMRGIDGYEVARRVRRRPGGNAIRLVAWSGYSNIEAPCLAAGFDHFLAKPIAPEDFRQLLEAPPRTV